jgi:hypothetical protein
LHIELSKNIYAPKVNGFATVVLPIFTLLKFQRFYGGLDFIVEISVAGRRMSNGNTNDFTA